MASGRRRTAFPSSARKVPRFLLLDLSFIEVGVPRSPSFTFLVTSVNQEDGRRRSRLFRIPSEPSFFALFITKDTL